MVKKDRIELLEVFHDGRFKRVKSSPFQRFKRDLKRALERIIGTADAAKRPCERAGNKSAPDVAAGIEKRDAAGSVSRPASVRSSDIVVPLSGNRVIFLVMIIMVLLVGAFAAGYLLAERGGIEGFVPVEKDSGRRIAKERSALKEFPALNLEKTKDPEVVISKKEPSASDVPGGEYRIQVITLPSHYRGSAEELVYFFKEKGIDAESRVVSNGRYIALYAGSFEDRNSRQCRDLLQAIQNLAYKGKARFKDAYIVKVGRLKN